jgi:hypothetical protein
MATDANSAIRTQYTVGLNHVGSYQAAGTPWLTASLLGANPGKGSAKTFVFPSVAKSVTVTLTSPRSLLAGKPELSENVAIYFGESKTEAGTLVEGYDVMTAADNTTWPAAVKQSHVRILQLSQSFDVGARVDKINIALINGSGTGITGSVTIYAELTNIPESRMATDYISGSGVNTY